MMVGEVDVKVEGREYFIFIFIFHKLGTHPPRVTGVIER